MSSSCGSTPRVSESQRVGQRRKLGDLWPFSGKRGQPPV
jgi:hypothetical protein